MKRQETPTLVGELDAEAGFRPLTFDAGRGTVETRWYESPGATAAVIYVGGVGGGFDTPAAGLYPRLATDLASAGIAGLRVRYRNSLDLEEAAYDVLVGAAFLVTQGADHIGLVGHSFGGAVVLQAASRLDQARTVVTLATQSLGAEAASVLGPECSLLLVHGEGDRVLPPASSSSVFSMARDPKQLKLLPAAGHSFDEAAEEVHDLVLDWLSKELSVLGE